ncbi:MAG: hypothetical protein ACKOOG_08460 [Actinomycetota bacterium]
MATASVTQWRVAPLAVPAGEVASVVAGDPVRAWTADIPIADAPEAWPTGFAIPAARAGVALEVPHRLDPTWRNGVDANLAAAAEWWGGEDRLRVIEPRRGWFGARRDRRGPMSEAADGRALFFTGGVDSFFSLLAGAVRPTHLVFVAGYDVELDDAERLAATRASLEAVAAGVGAMPVVVSTDLRTHPAFVPVAWQHTHGAALAAIGHLLRPTIGTVIISPSWALSRMIPWGSRPDLDPRWSVPGRTEVLHGDASGSRFDRVRAIAADPLVHEHLRVCWQNVAGTLNCGRCEKCVRTMVMLAGVDQLQHCRTFPDRAQLPSALDDVPQISPTHLLFWADLVDLPLRTDERVALDALFARST